MRDEEFTDFVNQCRPLLLDYVSCIVRDGGIAEDIVQESFVRIWKRNLSKKDKPYSLALKISANLCVDFFRKRKVREKHLHQLQSKLSRTPEEILMSRDFVRGVNVIINKTLPKNMKNVLMLKMAEGKSTSEISDIFGVSKRTVDNYLYRARRILRKELDCCFYYF